MTLRRRSAFERVSDTSRDPGYFIPYRQKRGFVCLGWIVKSADLSCELQGSSWHAFGRDRRIKIDKGTCDLLLTLFAVDRGLDAERLMANAVRS